MNYYITSWVIILIQSIIDLYISYRQYRVTRDAKEPPEIFKDRIDEKEFQQCKSYDLDYAHLGFILFPFELVKSLLELHYFGKIWGMTKYGGEIIHSLIFVFINDVFSLLVSLPISYYKQFHIEEKYGFNKNTIKQWIVDNIKSFGISLVIEFILYPVLILVYQKTGSYFILIAMAVMIVFSLLLNVLYPILIYPLFNKLTPLEDGEVKTEITTLAEETKFNAKRILVEDTSKRSKHSNAMVFGIFKKQIALSDNLLEQFTPKEIAAIVGHEIGHEKHHHIYKQFFIGTIQTTSMLWILYAIMHNTKAFQDFGIVDETPLIVGLVLTSLLMGPIGTLLAIPLNYLSQYFEYQADAFAANRNLPIDAALIKLAATEKSAIDPDWLHHILSSSHPTTVHRVSAAREIMKKFK